MNAQVAEIVLHGFMAWAVINFGLMALWFGAAWWAGRGRRHGERAARQLGGWR